MELHSKELKFDWSWAARRLHEETPDFLPVTGTCSKSGLFTFVDAEDNMVTVKPDGQVVRVRRNK